MGLIIKRNKKGDYNLTNSISDECYHPEKKWISEDEAKKILIENAFWRFLKDAIEIDMTFPGNYRVNDIMGKSSTKFLEWWLETIKSENSNELIEKRIEELFKRLNIDIKI